MTVRQVWVAVAMVLVVAGFGVRQSEAAEGKRPNIVFIFSDDHAYQAVGAYGGYLKDVVRTPNLDKLASQGTLFRRCFVTNSICGPMRAVIQTGKYSHLNGFIRNGNKFNGDQATFPKLLKKAGYQTAVIGKWHLGTHQAPQGYDYSEVLVGQGPYYNPPMLKDADGTGDNKQRTKEQHTGYTTDIITDLTLKWLKEGRDKSKPFMLMTQHKAPHRAWDPRPDVYAGWRDVKIPEPETLFEDYSKHVDGRAKQSMTIARHFRKGPDDKTGTWAPGNLNAEQKKAYLEAFAAENADFAKRLPNMTEEERVRWMHQRYAKIYLACIESVDDNVGRILKYLDESGLAENTIVIYTSDQGFYLGEHGWYDKRWVYEESLKTPLIVRWPGVTKPGTENGDIVSPLDFAQTFLEIAGVDEPAEMQGRSLVPVLKGKTPDDWRKSHYYHYYELPGPHSVTKHYAVCTDRYKLIYHYGRGENQWELIDLKVDPLETKNIYGDPKYADTQKELHAELKRLRKHYNVPEGDADPKQPRKKVSLKAIDPVVVVDGPDPATRGDLDPSNKPMTVAATITPTAPDGVIMSQGGGAYGWSLYLAGGKPTFTIRDESVGYTVASPKAIATERATHVAGVLTPKGALELYVDGKRVATADGAAITKKPGHEYSFGKDTLDPVGDYAGPATFAGSITHPRVIWGALNAKAVAALAAHK